MIGWDFPGGTMDRNPPASTGDTGWISGLENPMDCPMDCTILIKTFFKIIHKSH